MGGGLECSRLIQTSLTNEWLKVQLYRFMNFPGIYRGTIFCVKVVFLVHLYPWQLNFEWHASEMFPDFVPLL